MADERLFQVALGVLVFQVEELQDERVLDLLLGPHEVFGAGRPSARQHGGPVLREGGALVELGADLPVELPNRPPSPQRLGLVELTGVLVPDRQEPHVGRPGQRKGRQKVVELHSDMGGLRFARRRLENLPSRG